MINIYLCEDENAHLKFYGELIDGYIRKNNIEANIFSARCNPEDTLNDVEENGDNPALFFIDVELKGYKMDGFSLCRELKREKREFYFVFLTAKNELAYKDFEYELDVLDYIIKEPRCFLEKRFGEELTGRLERIFRKVENGKRDKKLIWVECGSRKVGIEPEQIICVQSIKGTHQMEIITKVRRVMVRQTVENMLASMGGYIKEKRLDELEKFFAEQMQIPVEKMDENNRMWIAMRYVHPLEFKGFLYEKVLIALAKKVSTHVDVYEEVHLESSCMNDMLRMLGIFIDNAIEAAEECEKGRMNLIIRKTENGVLIRIENNYKIEPDFSRMFEKGYSTKGKGRGTGLYWAKGKLAEYNEIVYDFCVEDEMVIQQIEVGNTVFN